MTAVSLEVRRGSDHRDDRTKQWVESMLAPIVERHPVAAQTEPELGLRPPGFVEPLAREPVGGGDHEHLPDVPLERP